MPVLSPFSIIYSRFLLVLSLGIPVKFHEYAVKSFTRTPSIVLQTFAAEAGSDDESVVGYPKTFHPDGPGVEAGDRAKWVDSSVSTDEGCEAHTKANEALVSAVLGQSDDEAGSASPAHTRFQASFVFSEPTLAASHLQLCYKHQDEPYHLHAEITLRTRQLLAANVRAVGLKNALTAIVGSPQPVSFTAHGGMEGDRYKWVQAAQDSPGTVSAAVTSCDESMEPAAGSDIGVSLGFYQEASFTFSAPASGLILCYAPGDEPFVAYPNITMDVLAPSIVASNQTHLIVGKSVSVRLVGTFGLTSGDAVKLAENAEGDCHGSPAGGDSAIFYPHGLGLGLTGTSTGTSDVTLLVSQRTESNRPYKLCYRFGASGRWEMFDEVALEAFEVTSAYVDGTGDGYPASGELLSFTFGGTGVLDGGEKRRA